MRRGTPLCNWPLHSYGVFVMTSRATRLIRGWVTLSATVGVLLVWLPPKGSAASGPPVVTESFTKLPCPAKPKSTLDFEGCLERTVLRSDSAINARAAEIFQLLRPRATRTAFVEGERSWLVYRRKSCDAEASIYAGGSAEPLALLRCTVDRNKTHQTDLAALKRAIQH